MKKIIIGNNVNIEMDNCIIEIGSIEIIGTINSNFSFNIVRDELTIKTAEFPLNNQTLLDGDYLDSTGIHRPSTEEFFEYTDEQLIAFENMTNINISKGNFNVLL